MINKLLIHLNCIFILCQVLGFSEYIEEVYAAYEQHKLETMVIIGFLSFTLRKHDKNLVIHSSHVGPFKKKKITQQDIRSGKWTNGADMTEEEALAEQQRMFAEAKARMNGGSSTGTGSGTAASIQPEPDQNLES